MRVVVVRGESVRGGRSRLTPGSLDGRGHGDGAKLCTVLLIVALVNHVAGY